MTETTLTKRGRELLATIARAPLAQGARKQMTDTQRELTTQKLVRYSHGHFYITPLGEETNGRN